LLSSQGNDNDNNDNEKQRVTIMAFEVTLLHRNGSVDKSRFFSEGGANDYLVLNRGNGRHIAGAIESNLQRVADFGLMRDGTTLAKARKALKEMNE
jgi:hypothetical protein